MSYIVNWVLLSAIVLFVAALPMTRRSYLNDIEKLGQPPTSDNDTYLSQEPNSEGDPDSPKPQEQDQEEFILEESTKWTIKSEMLKQEPVAPGDPTYNMFATVLSAHFEMVTYKMTQIRESIANTSKLYIVPTDEMINTTLTECYTRAENATADPICLEQIAEETRQFIIESQQELGFCSNLTQSSEQLTQVLQAADLVMSGLTAVKNTILTEASSCVNRFPRNPSLKYKCMLAVQRRHDVEWVNASAAVNNITYELSGLNLLYGDDFARCRSAELSSITPKCVTITSDLSACSSPA